MPDVCLSGKSSAENYSEYRAVKNMSVTEVQDTDNRSVLGRRERLANQTGVVGGDS